MFSLILVRCNYRTLRDRILATIKSTLSQPLQEVYLTPQTTTLFTAIQQALGTEQPKTLIVYGLERVENLTELLRVANQSREEFRNHLPCPLAIWITDGILRRLIREATDFESWASITIEFESDLKELSQVILETTEALFEQLLNSRENVFLDNHELHLEENSPLRIELRAACEELHRQLDSLPTELTASMQFILGRVADNNEEEARQHYERSLDLWQQAGNLERYAYVQFSLGLWWGNYAVRHLANRSHGLQKARAYLEGAIATFEDIGQENRVAQFINFLGEVLHRQGDWEALNAVSHKALYLHQRYCNDFRQAKALGLMAEVAIAKPNWSQAEHLANQALVTWQKAADAISDRPNQQAFLNWERSFHRPWYLYSLGKAQQHTNKLAEATHHLEEARRTAKPSYDPDLYTQILDELREIYFQRKQYLDAYKTRQARRNIQGRFNLRPFTGAGRLQASQEITNPSLPQPQTGDQIAPEIQTSGREQDLATLLQRIERKDFRLTVIHGPSGVGKSSLLQAGLVPAIKQQTFDGLRVIPVLQQVYTNWFGELSNQLSLARIDAGASESKTLPLASTEDILNQLRQNQQENFKTVLIFDQFEEFFFANPDLDARQEFYDFAVECFRILDTEIILSMREDYVYNLLICNRLSGLEIIGNNILDKKILYYVGNFTKGETYNLIQSQTKNTQVQFNEDLINQIVTDLADNFDQIRPIELQIVCSQLQSDNIQSLTEYQALADNKCRSKEILVHRYLENVVQDCGPENQEVAEIILYLLTNEDGTRPIKTKSELVQAKLYTALQNHPKQLQLILEIFVRAGLVFLIPSAPAESYQLVHDYLVNFIREKVQHKHQAKIENLEQKVAGLGRVIRLLAVLLLCLVPVGLTLEFFARRNALLHEVTELERDSIEYKSTTFAGYQGISLGEAVISADKLNDNLELENRTTLPIHTLQYIVDNISEKKSFDTGQDRIFTADISSDEQQIATADFDGTLKIWNLNSGLGQLNEPAHTIHLSTHIQQPEQVWKARFLPGDETLATIDSLGYLTVWDVSTLKPVPNSRVLAHEAEQSQFTHLDLSSDRPILATAGGDGRIKLWDAETLELQNEWQAHSSPVGSLQFSPSGSELISADYAGQIHIWELDSPTPNIPRQSVNLNSQPTSSPLITYGLAVSPDEKILVTASQDGLVRLWDFASGELLYEFLAHNGKWVTAVHFMPPPESNAIASDEPLESNPETSETPNYHMVTSDEDGGIRSWSVSPDTSVQLLDLKGHQGWIWNLLHTASTPDPLLISTSLDGTLRLWDLRDPIEKSPSLLANFPGHAKNEFGQGTAWSVSYSPGQALLATSGSDGTAKIWQLADLQNPNMRSKEPLYTLEHKGLLPVHKCQKPESDRVFWVVFSPHDEQTVATAGEDCTVKLWQNFDMPPKSLPHSNGAAVNSVDFSPDGRYIASVDSKGNLFLWTADGEPIGEPIRSHEESTFAVKFSPDSRYIATASDDGTVKLWSVQALQQNTETVYEPATTLPNHRNGATGIDFSDDDLIATAGRDGKVRIWSLKAILTADEPQPIQELLAHEKRVTWVEFNKSSHQNEYLATTSKDGSVIIWDRSIEDWGPQQRGEQFKLRYQFAGHQDGAFSVTFLQEGGQIAVTQGDSQVKLWKLENTPELIQRACEWLEVPRLSRVDERPDRVKNWLWLKTLFGFGKNNPDITSVCRKHY